MTYKIILALVGTVVFSGATTGLALAWPNQPPGKVLISGPGIEGQVELKDESARSLFRLGDLEDFDHGSPPPLISGAGYKIVRFFYRGEFDGGEFDFGRITYYPDSSGGRGFLYFEDGPMLQGDHTPYDQTWLYAKPDGELKLRALLKQLGAGLDGEKSALVPIQVSSSASAASSDSTRLRDAGQADRTSGGQAANVGETNSFPGGIVWLVIGPAGLLLSVVAITLWRRRQAEGGSLS